MFLFHVHVSFMRNEVMYMTVLCKLLIAAQGLVVLTIVQWEL